MGEDTARPDLQGQIDALIEGARDNRHDIDQLQSRADESEDRAADLQQQADNNHKRLDDVVAAEQLDREMIAELQAQGLVSQAHADQLQEALQTSRNIGAAIGVIMATRNVDQDAAFTILARASSHSNRKLRDIAGDILATATEVPNR